MLIRSISGLRATLGDDLTPEVVARYAVAFSAILPEGPIVVGRDGRPSGVWMEQVLIGALRACGRTVRQLGMVPTPTVQLLTEHTDAVGGIAITASHNPAPWNGLKFVDAGGVFLDAEDNQRLWNQVDQRGGELSPLQQAGSFEVVSDAIEQHIDRVLSLSAVAAAPPAAGQTVVVDAVNCSGSEIVPMLLERLGYRVVRLHADGSGIFPHVPEPLAENLMGLGRAVLEHGAAFGVAVDPDADRLVLFDRFGAAIGEEKTVALATRAVLSAGHLGPVVVNFSSSRMTDDVAAEFGCSVERAPVGEINVVRHMQRIDAVIGGEGSGGVIYPACHAGRDSIVGLALISAMLRRENITLEDACARLTSYTMIKTKIDLASRVDLEPILQRITERFADAIDSTLDGIYLRWSDRWAHIRASNTEPIMRVIAEARSEQDARDIVSSISSLIGG
ncbi:MAG: phosphoglucosamine mutase [Candidatus Kapabacteria bacterium]|nr:phosphoglucosamine mutase [Candidatus Kapabacteria bacterium]